LTGLALPAWAGPLRVVVAPAVDRTGRVPADVLAKAGSRARERLRDGGRFSVIFAEGAPDALALVADATAIVSIEPTDQGQRVSIAIRSLPSMTVIEEG